MSAINSETEISPLTELQPQQIADYLRQNPDFFNQHPELLTELQIPHRSGTVSLIERQITQLRNENNQLKKRLSTLLINAEANEDLLIKTRVLTLRLLEASTPAQLSQILEQSLCDDFGAHQCQAWTLDKYRMAGCKQLNSEQVALELSRLILPRQPHCGLLKADETEMLFAGQSEEVGSALVIPLFMPVQKDGTKGPLIGILAIGNKDKDYYRDNMSTSLLTYLSDLYLQLLLKTNKAQQPQSV